MSYLIHRGTAEARPGVKSVLLALVPSDAQTHLHPSTAETELETPAQTLASQRLLANSIVLQNQIILA